MANFLGVDCGATNLRAGILDEVGNLLEKFQVESPLKTNASNFAKIVKNCIKKYTNFTGIGIAVPGPIDPEKGLILPSPNIGNKDPIDIRGQFKQHFNQMVQFDRDTNAALLGEKWQGAAVGLNNVVMLTLGSGVGGAIMIGGEIDRGESGKAGEIGHIYLEVGSLPVCGLGHKGCLEALINSAQNVEELGIYLGYGLANIVDIFNPQKIIIGGGKIKMGDFIPKAVAVMKEKGMKPAVDEVMVEYAKLGEWSGVYGAAYLAMTKIQ